MSSVCFQLSLPGTKILWRMFVDDIMRCQRTQWYLQDLSCWHQDYFFVWKLTFILKKKKKRRCNWKKHKDNHCESFDSYLVWANLDILWINIPTFSQTFLPLLAIPSHRIFKCKCFWSTWRNLTFIFFEDVLFWTKSWPAFLEMPSCLLHKACFLRLTSQDVLIFSTQVKVHFPDHLITGALHQ